MECWSALLAEMKWMRQLIWPDTLYNPIKVLALNTTQWSAQQKKETEKPAP